MATCRKGLHEMTPANTTLRADGHKQCKECRYLSNEALVLRRKLIPKENDLTCRRKLHPWIPENWRTNGRMHVTCAPCAREQARARYWRSHAVWCIVGGCRRRTVNAGDAPYICPDHRLHPPEWLTNRIMRGEVRIVGSEVLAA